MNKIKLLMGAMLLFSFALNMQIMAQDNIACGKKVTYQGKTYKTVQIGEQCWFQENLNVGTKINMSSKQTKNDTIEKYCYNNDPANCEIYGGLYQWNEVMQYEKTVGAQGICPDGWHVPTKADWEILIENVNGEASKLTDKNAKSGYTYSNKSGFSALLSGYSNAIFGCFYGVEYYNYYWSSSNTSKRRAYSMYMSYNYDSIALNYDKKNNGLSVRCIKN